MGGSCFPNLTFYESLVTVLAHCAELVNMAGHLDIITIIIIIVIILILTLTSWSMLQKMLSFCPRMWWSE